MKDPRSIGAAYAAIAFGERRITAEELKKHANSAYAAVYAAAFAAAFADDADAAAKANQQLTAGICRKYLAL